MGSKIVKIIKALLYYIPLTNYKKYVIIILVVKLSKGEKICIIK